VLIGAHRPRIDVEIGVERACKSAPSAADARPLPKEETTPPVMKMYRAMGVQISGDSERASPGDSLSAPYFVGG
jgi:hypothetical protein